MNWASPDADVLEHWRKLGQFRRRHVALARGAHAKLADAPYTFSRQSSNDRVVVAIGMSGRQGERRRGLSRGRSCPHAYTGATAG